jgi:hypothetical protein
MIKKLLPYILIILAVWYFPEFYLLSKNASNYIYKEAVARKLNKVEVKIVRPIEYLPKKYAVINAGELDLRVELVSTTKVFSRSAVIRADEKTALLSDIPSDEYTLNVGPIVDYSAEEIQDLERDGVSVFSISELLPITPKIVIIKGDTFIAPIIQ